MNIKIRAIRGNIEKHTALLMFLQRKCLPYDEPYDVSVGHWWIAYDGDKPIGFAGLVRSSSWYDCGYLCRAGVLSAYRGVGVQKKLIAVRVRKAKRLGFKWVISDTRDNNASANSLISQGFRMFTPTKPWGYNDTDYWRRRVDAV